MSTPWRETAARRQAQDDRNALDHFPVCPGCGDLCGVLAQVCANCKAQLYSTDLDLANIAAVGLQAMRRRRLAALVREDTEARNGTES